MTAGSTFVTTTVGFPLIPGGLWRVSRRSGGTASSSLWRPYGGRGRGGLTAAVVVAAFHRRRVLPLMARQRRLFEMTPSDPIAGIKMSAFALTDDETLRRVREAVDGKPKIDDLMPFPMRPSRGHISLVSWMLPRLSRPSCFLPFLSVVLLRRSRRG